MSSSSWQIEIDRVSPLEWARLVEQFDDANLYQTFSYGRVRWGVANLSHIVLKRNDEVVAVAQLRILQPTKLKLGIAYLRWGPLWERRGLPPDPEVIYRIVEGLEEEYVQRRGLLLRILPKAFVGSMRGLVMGSALGRFRAERAPAADGQRTLVQDMSPALYALRRQLERKWRNQLTSAEKRNLTVTSGTSLEEFRTFVSLYWEMRLVKRFDSGVDPDEFVLIQDDLPKAHRMRVFLCYEDRTPVASAVISVLGDTAIYLLGATVEKGRRAKASYLLQWNVIQWLKEQGTRWYDLGGINPEKNPGVYHFKRGLSGKDEQLLGVFTRSNGAMSAMINAGLALHRALK